MNSTQNTSPCDHLSNSPVFLNCTVSFIPASSLQYCTGYVPQQKTILSIREDVTSALKTWGGSKTNKTRVGVISQTSTENLTLVGFNLTDSSYFTMINQNSFAETACKCTTVTTTTAQSSAGTQTPIENILRAMESSKASTLNSNQVETVVSVVESVVSQPSINLNLANASINTLSNLLDASPQALAFMSNRIIDLVDEIAQKLEVEGKSTTLVSPSLTLAVKRVNETDFHKTLFTLTNSSSLQIDGGPITELSLQGSISLPASLLENLTAEKRHLVSRVTFCFYQNTTLFQSSIQNDSRLISGVLGSSVGNLSLSNLRENVTITMTHDLASTKSQANYTVSCAFWDFHSNSGCGAWNTSGCTMHKINGIHTVCTCNHLTHFGVLLDLSDPTQQSNSIILTIFTNIGCSISIIFLTVTVVTYLWSEKLHKDVSSKILIQLCLALLLLNLLFLLDSLLATELNQTGLCISTAFFLNYFLLASFTWMTLQAVHLYLTIVKVFNTYIPQFMIKVSLIGWGVPLAVLITALAIDRNIFGFIADGATANFCWWKNRTAYRIVVGTYFCVTFLLNISIFIVVMVLICKIKKQMRGHHCVQKLSILQDLRSVTTLAVLLGLGWIFALFALDIVYLPFMYLFTICNSLQGFLIFVFRCAANEKVRRQCGPYLCYGQFMLRESSGSQTAEQSLKS